jgi:hypothetical protein
LTSYFLEDRLAIAANIAIPLNKKQIERGLKDKFSEIRAYIASRPDFIK